MVGDSRKTITLSVSGDALVIEPGASCSVGLCPSVQSAVGRLRTPSISRIVIDLSRAQRMDSSFIGLLVGMLGRKTGQTPTTVQLCRPNDEIRTILANMGVLVLFEIVDHLPEAGLDREEIPVRIDSTDALADLVIDAHENLMEADPRNVDKFEPVVRGLRERRGK